MREVQVTDYFERFLPSFFGKCLIVNLTSLSANFWIEVDDKTWSLEIEKGILISVSAEKKRGDFGYRTGTRTFLDVVRAKLSPQKSFFMGRTKIDGKFIDALKTATALEEFFKKFPYI